MSAKLCGVEQRAPPTFSRAAITLGICRHSSFLHLRGAIFAANSCSVMETLRGSSIITLAVNIICACGHSDGIDAGKLWVCVCVCMVTSSNALLVNHNTGLDRKQPVWSFYFKTFWAIKDRRLAG